MMAAFLFLYTLISVVTAVQDGTKELKSAQISPQHITTYQCRISSSVFRTFTAWKCSEVGFLRMMGHCANFIAEAKHQQSYQIPSIARKLSVTKMMLLKKDGFKTKAGCCVREFASYKEVLLQVLLNDTLMTFNCDIIIVVLKTVQSLQLSSKKKKRSVEYVMNSVRNHQEKLTEEKIREGNLSSGAIFENSTVRMIRAANGRDWRRPPKLNETDWEKIRQRLAVKFSHDPEWAMISMTTIILLLLLAVKCCKLSDSNRSEMEYVDYIEDWHTTTVHEAVIRKLAFIDLIQKFKNRRKRKQKVSEEKQKLLSKKRSHSDGEENVSDDSHDFIAL